jgi:hypothetical protein
MLRRLNALINRHPLLSILAIFAALAIFTLLAVPEDPAYVDQQVVQHSKGAV